MRIGSFIAPERVGLLADAGADYAELFVTRTVMAGDARDFEEFRRHAERWPLRPRAFSGLLPHALKVVGPDIDAIAQDSYLREMFSRIEQLADEPVVATFGSANSRSVPDGFSRQTARDQVADFLGRASRIAGEHGAILALEHLNRSETNLFNSLRECGDFLREREFKDVFLLADFYHMMVENEPLSTIDEYADLIVHAHVADTDRDAPGTGDYPFNEFFRRLAANGYSGDCSIEAFWSDFDRHVGLAVQTCRRAAQEAGIILGE